MKVAVVGHRLVKITKEINEVIYLQIKNLIDGGANSFCFGYNGAFSDACYNAVSAFIKDGLNVKRVKYISPRGFMYGLTDDRRFEVTERRFNADRHMLKQCDVLLTFFDKNYVPPYSKNGKGKTYSAFKYASKKDKRIINIYDLI